MDLIFACVYNSKIVEIDVYLGIGIVRFIFRENTQFGVCNGGKASIVGDRRESIE